MKIRNRELMIHCIEDGIERGINRLIHREILQDIEYDKKVEIQEYIYNEIWLLLDTFYNFEDEMTLNE